MKKTNKGRFFNIKWAVLTPMGVHGAANVIFQEILQKNRV